MIAVLVALIGLVIAYELITGVLRGQKSSDARSTRALLEAQLLEHLLRDLRSVAADESRPPGETPLPALPEAGEPMRFLRWVQLDGRLHTKQVEWIRAGEDRIVRRCQGEPDKVFDFKGLLGPNTKLRFRIQPVIAQFGSSGGD